TNSGLAEASGECRARGDRGSTAVDTAGGADRYPAVCVEETAMSQHPDAETGSREPNLDFAGTTPYEDYIHADVLTHLQQPRSDDRGEMAFIVTTQVMELWFTVIVFEWQ